MQSMWLRTCILFAASLFLVFAVGCDDGDDGSGSLSLSEGAVTGSQVGWQMQNYLNTNEQFSGMVEGANLFEDEDPDLLNSVAEVRLEHSKMKAGVREMTSVGRLAKTTSDSLIWFFEWSDPISGTAGRRAFFYNTVTFDARYYEVVFQFPQAIQLEYDSTDVQAYLGPSLEDTTDDRLNSIAKLTIFEDGFYVEQVEGTITATAWDQDNEVTAGTATNTVNYGAQTELETLTQSLTFNEDESFEVSEQLDYRDGTFLSRSVDYANFAGTFDETWRDGSTVSGTFDLLEDDNHAAVSRTITLANHPVVSSIEQSADYILDPVDSSSTGAFLQRVFFTGGAVDTASILVDRFMESGLWKESFVVETSNDGSAEFTVTFYDVYKEFAGNHTSPDGFYTIFNGVEYEDGSGELWLSVYQSEDAYLAGDPPILTAHFIFNGFGGGEGNITEGADNFSVKFSETGEIEVSDDKGNSEVVNGF